MIAKTRTGVDFFDDRYGGAYRGRALLVSGRRGAGKSIFSLQFLAQGLKQGERCLLLSGRPAADVALYAHALDLPLGEAVDSGHLIVLEYSDYVPGQSEASLTLPSDGFVQLQEIIQSNGVQRVALDTCLPWVSVPVQANVAEHVFSFVRSFDRLATTTLLTLPKPVSPMSFRLKSVLEETVPVAVTLQVEEPDERRSWIVSKYLGEARLDSGTEFIIATGVGIRKGTMPAAAAAPAPAAAPSVPPSPPPSDANKTSRVRFSKVVLPNGKPESPPASAPAGSRTFRWGAAVNR